MDLIIEAGVELAVAFLIALIGVFGTWLTIKIGKYEQLKNIDMAQREVIRMAQQTVEELQQTVVDDLKAGRKDGKLTKEEITTLGLKLYNMTMRKMSDPARNILNAAAVDIGALIAGAGESWISKMRGG